MDGDEVNVGFLSSVTVVPTAHLESASAQGDVALSAHDGDFSDLGVYDDEVEGDDLTDTGSPSPSRGCDSKVSQLTPVLGNVTQPTSPEMNEPPLVKDDVGVNNDDNDDEIDDDDIDDDDDDDAVISDIEADLDGEGVASGDEIEAPLKSSSSKRRSKVSTKERHLTRAASDTDGFKSALSDNIADVIPAVTYRGDDDIVVNGAGGDEPYNDDENNDNDDNDDNDNDNLLMSPRDSARGGSPDSTLSRSTLDGSRDGALSASPRPPCDASAVLEGLSRTSDMIGDMGLLGGESQLGQTYGADDVQDGHQSSSSSTARERMFKRALNLLHKRCVSVATTVAVERQRPGSGLAAGGGDSDEGGKRRQPPPFYETRDSPMMATFSAMAANKRVKYVYMEQNQPMPLDPVKAWKGYNGNIYFEPLRIAGAPTVGDVTMLPTSAPLLNSCSPMLQDILRKRETFLPTATDIRYARQTPASSHRPGVLPDPYSLERRQMSVLDREAVMSRYNPRLTEDVAWIRGQESIGSLTVEAGAGDRARTAHRFRRSKLCKGSVSHQLKLLTLASSLSEHRTAEKSDPRRFTNHPEYPRNNTAIGVQRSQPMQGVMSPDPSPALRGGALRTAAATAPSPLLRSTTQYSMSRNQVRGGATTRLGGMNADSRVAEYSSGVGARGGAPLDQLGGTLRKGFSSLGESPALPSPAALARGNGIAAGRPTPAYVKLDRMG